MFLIPPEPSEEEISLLRSTVLKKLQDDGLFNDVDQRDVSRFKNDNHYLQRFLMHHDNDQKLALDMAIDTFKWRKKVGANDITEKSLDRTLLEKGALFIHNRDVDGCKMLIFFVRNHFKDAADPDKVKTILIYWVERLEREEQGKWITVFFDMREAGLKNMDMEFIQYMINLFKYYYPWILNYIIVFEMPWLFNAMWKIIKGWLPPKSINKIKFVDKKSIQTYISEDECLVGWGGKDDYSFRFEAEDEIENTPCNLSNGDVDGKKVHFMEGNITVPDHYGNVADPSLMHITKSGTYSSPVSALEYSKFQVEPVEKLMFNSNQIGTSAVITFTNNSPSIYAFKIKATSPQKYCVRPSVGTLESRGTAEVVVTLTDQISPSVLVRDKFLVIAVPSSMETITQQDFTELLKKSSKLDVCEVRLRVGMTNADALESVGNHVMATPPVSPVLINKLDQLLTRQTVIEEQLGSLRRLLYVIFFLMIAILFVFVLTTNNLTSSLLAHTRASAASSHVHSHEL